MSIIDSKAHRSATIVIQIEKDIHAENMVFGRRLSAE